MQDQPSTPFPLPGAARLDEGERRWIARWQQAIDSWIAEQGDYPATAAVKQVPALLSLVIALIKAPEVPFALKGRLGAALGYIFNAQDDLPEHELGPQGLLDDALVAVSVLHNLMQEHPMHFPLALVQHYWAGEGEIQVVISQVSALRARLVGR
ncbi:MAG: hypothetical protein HC915_06930 [Anaerolineae bacterium]|nr:hypothetical protein [Anaerolineae bacterium]